MIRGWLLAALALGAACGQDPAIRDPSVPPTHEAPLPTVAAEPVSLEGTWVGEWTGQDGTTGGFELSWAPQGNGLAGTLVMSGRDCLPQAQVSGAIQGQGVRFEAVDGTDQAIFSGTLAGGELSGSYSTTCPEAGGTFRTGRPGTGAEG